MRKLYIHIGAHRTATSAIQWYLKANSNRLLKRRFFYPFNTRRHNVLFNEIFAHKRSVDDVCAQINTRISSRKGEIESVILSDEDISMRANLKPLLAFKKYFDVKIVYCLRRQDLWLESWYFQNIKWQWQRHLSHLSFDDFLRHQEEFHWIDYRAYVTQLEELFGRENVMLSVFERGQMPEGPVTHFAKMVGIPKLDGLKPIPPSVNQSLTPVMTEFLRHLPLDDADPNIRSHWVKAAHSLEEELKPTFNEAQKSSLLMTLEQREKCLARYADSNAWIAQRYFERDKLFFDPLPAADAVLANGALPQDRDAFLADYMHPYVRALFDVQASTIERLKTEGANG
ncbi:MAG: hypothetical protein AAFQ05_00065 [Pseudomonadota bacterium]